MIVHLTNLDRRNFKKKPTVVDSVADELREKSLKMRKGDFLGSEDSLTQHFNISAPTLRQAARQLEHEEIIKVKRGVRGGYFADRPRIETIGRVASTYLRGSMASQEEARVLVSALIPLIVQSIMDNDNIDELAQFVEPKSSSPSFPQFVEEETQFAFLLQKLTANAALQLVLTIFYQVGLASVPVSADGLERDIAEIQELRVALAKALLARDEEAALALAFEHRNRIRAA